jgi:hypothetical protein
VQVTITGTPKLAIYLDDLIAEEGLGNTRAEVAKALVWQAIRDFIRDGVLTRRPGPIDTRDEE